jgi:hypothetical protein
VESQQSASSPASSNTSTTTTTGGEISVKSTARATQQQESDGNNSNNNSTTANNADENALSASPVPSRYELLDCVSGSRDMISKPVRVKVVQTLFPEEVPLESYEDYDATVCLS